MDIICKRCGLVNDYRTEPAGPHIKAICNGCGNYIKFLPQGKTKATLFFGKFKGRTVESMTNVKEVEYLYWVIGNLPNLKESLIESITNHLKRYPRP